MDSSAREPSSSPLETSSYKYLKGRKDSKSTNGTNGGGKTKPAIDVSAIVKGVIDDIRCNGDVAVRQYSEKFDKWSPKSFQLSEKEISDVISTLPEQTVKDIIEVQNNVRKFAEAQLATMKDLELEIQPGVFLGHKNIPISSVGAYIPGGRYPLFASAHMTILTAKVAGVAKVVGMTPPINGEIPSATVAAMYHAGADEIHILGGTQAIAGMALGPPRPKICGTTCSNAVTNKGVRRLYPRRVPTLGP